MDMPSESLDGLLLIPQDKLKGQGMGKELLIQPDILEGKAWEGSASAHINMPPSMLPELLNDILLIQHDKLKQEGMRKEGKDSHVHAARSPQ